MIQRGETQLEADSQEIVQVKAWKQEAIAIHPQVGKLISSETEMATFLYNMYKSCTVHEIDEFKECLEEIREGTIRRATAESLTNDSKQLAQLARDLIDIDGQIRLKIEPAIVKLDDANKAIQSGLLAQVRELKE